MSVLFDVNDVFETFVRQALRDALGLDRRQFPQPESGPHLWLDKRDEVRLKPDLAWWDGDRCIFVGDAKYKRLAATGFVNSDLYQLLAYLVATDLEEGLLVYAKGEDVPANHIVKESGKILHVRVLDLEGSKQEILGEVQRLAFEVANLAKRRVLVPTELLLIA